MSTTNQFVALVGRTLLSIIFLVSGAGKLMHWHGTVVFMAAKGMPAVPVFLGLAILFELGGGLSLLTGYRARLTAIAVFLYLIPVTLIFHNFWAANAAHYQMQLVNFMKNLAIMGGLLVLAAHGPGPLSLGYAPKHAVSDSK